MDYSNGKYIFTYTNNWKYKQFSLGLTFASEERFTLKETIGITRKREYYIGLYLGFWQLFVGIVI